MKPRVPSIGSSTQTYSASGFSVPNSSPRMPWSGKLRLMSWRITASPARSASVTGSKAAMPAALSSVAKDARKKGRMAWPDWVASSSTNRAKSTTLMLSPIPARHAGPRPASAGSKGRRGPGVKPRGRAPQASARSGTGATLSSDPS